MERSKDPEQGIVVQGQPAYYGTFQGHPSFPQATAPSGAPYYPVVDLRSYASTSVPGIQSRVSEGRPLIVGDNYGREDKLPFCNLGWGWFLFIIGFFSVIPWYIGAIVFCLVAHDYRERPGLMACAIASLIVFFQIVVVSGWGQWTDNCVFCVLR